MEYKEIFKDIEGFEGEYQINTTGDVYRLKFGKERLLKPSKHTDGYLKVGLWKDGKRKWFYVHRLVAEAFLPNPDNLPEINHKNEDKTDNRVENLEWCDRKYNVNFGTCQKRRAETRSKPVNQFTKDGLLIASYPSAHEAERQTGFSTGNICSCCNGKIKSSYGYIWRYV